MNMNYIYIDIDGPVIRVYDSLGTMAPVTFVAGEEYAESSSDRVCDSRRDAERYAEKYAIKVAGELGCDYGSNG
jgi:hypothetical protein